MFDSDEWRRKAKVGRQHVKIMPNAMGEKGTWILQLATRTETGYNYGKAIHDKVFVSRKEATKYRRENIYGNQSVKGGFKPETTVITIFPEPGKVMCRQCGASFKTVLEAYEHQSPAFENCKKRALCGHVSYRNHEDMCIEPGCMFAAYQEGLK